MGALIGRMQTAMDRSAATPWPHVARPPLASRALVLATLLSLALAAALLGLGAARPAAPSRPGSGSLRAGGLASLPLLARGPISAALGAEGRAYRVASSSAGLQAANPAQHLRARFARAGVSISSGALHERLRLGAIGHGDTLTAVGAPAPTARANRVAYAGHGLSEWYANGPLGLEQGFTVARAPAGHRTGPLTLSIALAGNAHAALTAGGESITLSGPGAASLRYGALAVTDAGGRVLHSWLGLDAGRLLLRVDDAGARYPLRIDPLIEQAKLEAGMVGEGHFGRSVALSANGNTALLGTTRESEFGAAWVFTRSGSTWTEQARLEGVKGEGPGAYFGRGVALSGDGNTALIGDPGSKESAGDAWVYTRSGSTWTRRAKLTGSGEIGAGSFGERVALSGDGSTALIGGFSDNNHAGAAWVFTGSGSSWTQQGTKLTGEGEIGRGEFGRSVALSGDGSTALIGGDENSTQAGAAWVFTRSGATWTQQAELQGEGEAGKGEFGTSVALSADAGTALVGGARDDGGIGAAWVFARSGSTWTQQGDKLTGGGEEGGEGTFGTSVALSSEGNVALVGAPDDDNLGAAWMFARSGGVWSQEGPKLTGGEESGPSAFGLSVALSSEGNTALIGGLAASGGVGVAAWVFAPPGPTVASIQPAEGPLTGGTEVRITGTHFTNSSTVSFGSTEATAVHVESPTQITATSPAAAAAGTVDVTVTTPGGITATGPADRFTYDPVPSVTALDPDEGPQTGGTSVAITGTGFTSTSTVDFGASEATGVEFESPTSMTATAPAGSGEVHVTVKSAGGTSAEDAASLFVYDPVPSLGKIEPGEGPAGGGTGVTITGTGFTDAASVSFGSKVSGAVKVSSPTSLTATAPPAPPGPPEPVTVDVRVSTAGGTSATSKADQFLYQPLPWVGSVEPGEGPAAGGTPVTITGERFTPGSKVSFGSSPATGVKFNSSTSITATSPAGSGKVSVRVTTTGGTSPKREGAEFTYTPPTMLLTGTGSPGGAGAGTGILPFLAVVLPPPQLGISGNLAPVSGTVRVRLPGTTTWVLLSTLRQVPFGTVIDATNGTVSVTTAGPHGGTQTGEFFGGEFVLTQGAKGTVVATLTGGSYAVCPTARERGHVARASSTHSSGKHAVRKLWANAHGSFSTKGTYAAGAVQGTEWLTEDLCDGTLIKVTRDKVKVTNLINHHTVEVTTGHSYFVKIS